MTLKDLPKFIEEKIKEKYDVIEKARLKKEAFYSFEDPIFSVSVSTARAISLAVDRKALIQILQSM